MVGVKKYEDEQIHFILFSQRKGHIAAEIVTLCQQRWPRKEFKVSGIKYVLQNYGKDPAFQLGPMNVQQMPVSGMPNQYGMPMQYPFQYGNSFGTQNFYGPEGLGVYNNPMGAVSYQHHGQGPKTAGGQIHFQHPAPDNQYGHMMHGFPNGQITANSHDALIGHVASMNQRPQTSGHQVSSSAPEDGELMQALTRALNGKNSNKAAESHMQHPSGSTMAHGGRAYNNSSPELVGAQISQGLMYSAGYQINNSQGNFKAGMLPVSAAKSATKSASTNATSVDSSKKPADPLLDPLLFAEQEAQKSSGGVSAADYASGNVQGFQLPHQFQELSINKFNHENAVAVQNYRVNQNAIIHQPYQFVEPTVGNVKKEIPHVEGKNEAREQVPFQFEEPPAMIPFVEPGKLYEENYLGFPFCRPATQQHQSTEIGSEREKVYEGYPEHPLGTPKIDQKPAVVLASSLTAGAETEFPGYPNVVFRTRETLRPASKSSDTTIKFKASTIAVQTPQCSNHDVATQTLPQAAAPAVLNVSSESFELPPLPHVISFIAPIFEQPFALPSFQSGWSMRAGTAEDITIELQKPDEIPDYILQSPAAIINLFNPVFKSGFFLSDYQPVSQTIPQHVQQLQSTGYVGTVCLKDLELNTAENVEESLFVPETPSRKVGLAVDESPNAMSAAIQGHHFDEPNVSIEQSPPATECSVVPKIELDALLSFGATFPDQKVTDEEIHEYFNYRLSQDRTALPHTEMQVTEWSSGLMVEKAAHALEVADPFNSIPVTASRKRGVEELNEVSRKMLRANPTTITKPDEQETMVPNPGYFEEYVNSLLDVDAREDGARNQFWANQGPEFDIAGASLSDFSGSLF